MGQSPGRSSFTNFFSLGTASRKPLNHWKGLQLVLKSEQSWDSSGQMDIEDRELLISLARETIKRKGGRE